MNRVKNKIDFGKISAEREPDNRKFYQINDSHDDCNEKIEAEKFAQESNHKAHNDKDQQVKLVSTTDREVDIGVSFANQHKESK